VDFITVDQPSRLEQTPEDVEIYEIEGAASESQLEQVGATPSSKNTNSLKLPAGISGTWQRIISTSGT
jgi:hypothetical protein